MMGLATVFFVEERTASPAAAGIAVGAFSITAAALAPWRGRWVDRHGIKEGLVPLVLLHACATAAFLLSRSISDSVLFFAIVAGVGGATAPPINAAMRALWPSLVEPESIDAAYATEAVLQEVSYLLGPLIVGLLVAVASPATAIALAAILTAIGGLAFSSHDAAKNLARSDRSRRPPLRHSGLQVILTALFFSSLAAGLLEIAIPTFADEHASPAGAGVLVAAMAAASLIAGVGYGARRWKVPPVQRLIGALAIATLGYMLMVPAGSLPALGVGALVVGLTSAPSMAAVYSILDDVTSKGTGVEAVTWITTATAGGAALGAALGGTLIDAVGMRTSLIAGTAALAGATALAFAGRTRLAGSSARRWTQSLGDLEALDGTESEAGVESLDASSPSRRTAVKTAPSP